MKKLLVLLASALPILGSCVGAQNSTLLDGISGISPFVEAFITYAGPHDRWAGPRLFVLHVHAKDAQVPVVSVIPGELIPSTGDSGRNLASESRHELETMSAEDAREALAELAEALNTSQPEFRGCMSPVGVRLVRADGALVEFQGCRGQNPWSHAISRAAARFLASVPALEEQRKAQKEKKEAFEVPMVVPF